MEVEAEMSDSGWEEEASVDDCRRGDIVVVAEEEEPDVDWLLIAKYEDVLDVVDFAKTLALKSRVVGRLF